MFDFQIDLYYFIEGTQDDYEAVHESNMPEVTKGHRFVMSFVPW